MTKLNLLTKYFKIEIQEPGYPKSSVEGLENVSLYYFGQFAKTIRLDP